MNVSDTLRAVIVNYVLPADCDEVFGSITNKQICVSGAVVDDLSSGACQGDSGGPLLFDSNGTLTQVGITSFGPTECGDPDVAVQSVYTSVGQYEDWIASVYSGSEEAKDVTTAMKYEPGRSGSLSWWGLVLLTGLGLYRCRRKAPW